MAAGDFQHSDMDISEQRHTYVAFMAFTKWACLFLAAGLFALVFWFCTPAGFVTGAVAGLAILVIGWLALRKKPGASH